MKEDITFDFLNEIRNEYNGNLSNKVIENAIFKNGLDNVLLNYEIVCENQNVFNIELPSAKITNQKASGRCWLFAALNMVKYSISKNLNIDTSDFELSSNYLTFYDKLEKSNFIYETIIKMDNIDLDYLIKEEVLSLGDGGEFEYARELILKYGVVPITYMKDSSDSVNTAKLNILFKEKIVYDVDILIDLKKDCSSDVLLYEKKKEFLKENYFFLAKILGEPITDFCYEYYDKDKKYVSLSRFTPLEFFNNFCDINLNDYVSIGSNSMDDKEYYKLYMKKDNASIYGKSNPIYLNLPISDLKRLAILQLKDKVPVWFACYVSNDNDKVSGVFDKRLFRYDEVLNISRVDKKTGLNYHLFTSAHAMVFVGVNVVSGKPMRWKVENSWGTQDMPNYLVMNDNYFEDYVYKIVINRKFLSQEEQNMLKQKPIMILPSDPI